jgi:hypothetical protein
MNKRTALAPGRGAWRSASNRFPTLEQKQKRSISIVAMSESYESITSSEGFDRSDEFVLSRVALNDIDQKY